MLLDGFILLIKDQYISDLIKDKKTKQKCLNESKQEFVKYILSQK